MNADNISQELPGTETHGIFHIVHKCQEAQKEDTVKHAAEKQKALIQENECKKLRRSYRSSVKTRRFEPGGIKLGMGCKSNSTKKSKIIRECFGSESESDHDVVTKKDSPATNGEVCRQDNYMNSKKKKRKPGECESPKKLENRRSKATNLENRYTISEIKSSYNENENKKKSLPESELRRSNRSPVKPTRFEPDIIICNRKINKRRVRDKAKRDSLNAQKTKSRSTKKSLTIRKIVYPSSEEVAEIKHRENEQMRANRKIKSLLKDLIQVPKKVKILSLNSMTADEILDTFPKYKDQLDVIFRELCSERKVTGYNGINHYSVIELIDNVKQLKMMYKLGEVYETDHDGVSMYPMLFANALMPEWLVYIFKDRYNLSYTEAVEHLDKQRQYIQYIAAEDHQ